IRVDYNGALCYAGVNASDDTVHGPVAGIDDYLLSRCYLSSLARRDLELCVELILPRDAADGAARLQLLPDFDVNRLHDATDTGDDLQVSSLGPGAIQRSRQLGDAGLPDSQLDLNVVANLFQAILFEGVGLCKLGQIQSRAP